METRRYGLRNEIGGTWAVFDVFTGLPAEIEGHSYVDLIDRDYATEIVDLLNSDDFARRLGWEAS
ncbi:hypothetical protein [Mesorhizobium sp. Cs1299R1N3]|uniref:hypothetical protein n=1 Tax=Mesorhizobium sp. Cs1299R1N3 TaxID=3015173 RepID=UPI00301BA9C5